MSWDDEPPEDLSAWLRDGFRRAEAEEWRRWRIELDEALAWRAAGVRRALTAAQWRTAAVTPDTVEQWDQAGIGPGEAVRWHEFGVDLATAIRHRAEGREPGPKVQAQYKPSAEQQRRQDGMQRFHEAGAQVVVAHTYYQADWFDDEALSWAKAGQPAELARLWQAVGLRPAEVTELDAAPGEVIARWWRAGIPFDEVADWIGAGLTPTEAQQQRAAGVTVEQAAALRALRRHGAG